MKIEDDIGRIFSDIRTKTLLVFVKYAPFQIHIFKIFMYFDSAKSVTVKCSYRVVVKYFIFLLKIVGI